MVDTSKRILSSTRYALADFLQHRANTLAGEEEKDAIELNANFGKSLMNNNTFHYLGQPPGQKQQWQHLLKNKQTKNTQQQLSIRENKNTIEFDKFIGILIKTFI